MDHGQNKNGPNYHPRQSGGEIFDVALIYSTCVLITYVIDKLKPSLFRHSAQWSSPTAERKVRGSNPGGAITKKLLFFIVTEVAAERVS